VTGSAVEIVLYIRSIPLCCRSAWVYDLVDKKYNKKEKQY